MKWNELNEGKGMQQEQEVFLGKGRTNLWLMRVLALFCFKYLYAMHYGLFMEIVTMTFLSSFPSNRIVLHINYGTDRKYIHYTVGQTSRWIRSDS